MTHYFLLLALLSAFLPTGDGEIRPALTHRVQTGRGPDNADSITLHSPLRGKDVERPEFAKYFERHGVEGCFILYDDATGTATRYNPSRCANRFLPASTFKIPSTLIALETGVLSGAEDTLRWDGRVRGVPDWNRDHDLRSAFRYSVVWYYQEVARRIGGQRMQRWVDSLGYGNRDISGGIDYFWLGGGMRISCEEQINFLRRLQGGALPVSARSVAVLREVMERERDGDGVMYAKTGWASGENTNIGWFVGWIERGGRRCFFATNVEAPPGDESIPQARIGVTMDILADMGLWQ